MLPELNELTRDYLVRLINKFKLKPKRRLSQHFVIEPTLIKDVINHVEPNLRVLEIGTGIGVLTYYLAKVSSNVVSIEIDGNLVKIAERILRGVNNVSIIQGDALSVPWPSVDAIVSNVPYSITSALIIRIIREGVPRALLTIQREVANRLLSGPGGDDYGRLSIVTQCHYMVELLGIYSPDSFYPSPEVYSSLIMMTRRNPCYWDLEVLELVTNMLFRHRNRVVRWVLNKYLGPEAVSEAVKGGVDVNARVRQLGVNDVVAIIESLRPYMDKIRALVNSSGD
ncbi:MAG: 16S rRNA (adenine(1518)-N(6)/adenine(1519)-N(6))-dimethyltransferase RsmA [Vulcanisaeta sp. AZ3]|jgi:16S rRNA (adenine1518-N6/adenine1519-N6)-dimethyltransferase